MAIKNVLTALTLTLLVPACLRLMDEPPDEGGTGFECYQSSQCLEGRHCLGTNRGVDKGRCGEPDQCEPQSSNCGPLKTCIDGWCKPVECTGAYDEPETTCGLYECNDETFTCKTSCEKFSDCSGDNVCRAGSCYADVCTTATAALICEGYPCDAVLGKCYSQGFGVCRDHGCANGYICVDDSKCKKPCTPGQASPQCGDYKCISEAHGIPATTYTYCAESCDAHSDCLNGKVCVDRQCASKP